MTSNAIPPVRIGVDIGGTFTDLQIFDARRGSITSFKTPTTPEDPSLGLLTGIKAAAARDNFTLADIGFLLHGTTIATNAVLERKLPRGALITTAGFEDVAEIGRHYRRDIYSLNPPVPPTLVPRSRRIGIEERMRSNGTAEIPLAQSGLDSVLRKIDGLDVAAVAVCLLNSYVNAVHEQQIADFLQRARPSLMVSISSAVSAEIREYERTSTTILNALLMPVIARYLDQLAARMEAEQCAPRLLLVQSNGGVCSTETAKQQPVRLLLSGPSGGSAACVLLAGVLGEANVVGVDMGGTSFDVSIVRDGRANIVTQSEIDRMPVRLPMVEIRTIGAGGGSLAKVREGGRLTVGPESAGSRPGPACYGRGGNEPTVTDANVVLGRLDPDAFLGGGMKLDLAAARTAVLTKVGEPLGLALEAASEGLLAVTNATLGAAIRLSLFEKGLDPREFAMIAFGGAAGLHALAVAEELGIRRVVFPLNASTLSAYGILHSDLAHDLVRSRIVMATPDNVPELVALSAPLLTEAASRLEADGVPVAQRVIELSADMRYKGQAFELTIPSPSAQLDLATLDALIQDFHKMHEQRFSYANPGAPVEIVSLRVSAIGRLPKPDVTAAPASVAQSAPGARKLWTGGGWQDVPVYQRDAIRDGHVLEGPAMIVEAYTSVLIDGGWHCHRHASGHLVAERQG